VRIRVKLKINCIKEYLGLLIYPIKPTAGLFILIKSRGTIPFSIKMAKSKISWKFALKRPRNNLKVALA
jgi:hypothetical protein